MSTILQNSIWPNTDGNLGNIKVQIPDGVNTFWPEGDALVGNFVYKNGKLVGLVDNKALTVNNSKSTIINYDYFDIELPFAENEMVFNRGARNKYFYVRYSDSNDDSNDDDNVIVTLKYKGCKTVDEVKAVDSNYKTTDIVDGVWSEGLGDLTTGTRMFANANLTAFSSDLSSLTNGNNMFVSTPLASFNTDLPSLTNGSYMFCDCSSLTAFSSDLSSLIDGNGMFNGCTRLTSFNSDLSSLTDGGSMFYRCPFATFSSDLSSLTNSSGMFHGCSNLNSFTSDLPSLTDGVSMFFYCESLASFSSDLSSLTDGSNMFSECSNLTTFSSDLSSLTDGSNMFAYCENLSEFDADLPELTNGREMFAYCENLSEFDTDLPSLTNGREMFRHCSQLTSFSSDLRSLTDGYGMFQYCKLDTASVQNIADTIKTIYSVDNGKLHIGIANTIPNAQEKAAFNTIASKNWTVYVGVDGGDFESEWNPMSLTPIDGEEQQTPIPFYAKPVQSDEEHAHYVDENGNFFNILGGNYIYGDDLSTYGMFISEADAAANMRLTKYVKPAEKA